jgi:CheY-like chemotaxis protein
MPEERQPRVLVIDDDTTVREVFSHLLASFGYDCHTAPNGARGLARFDERGWDLVLTDVPMPEMNGWSYRFARSVASIIDTFVEQRKPRPPH